MYNYQFYLYYVCKSFVSFIGNFIYFKTKVYLDSKDY